MLSDRRNLAEDLVKAAVARGADQADVVIFESHENTLDMRLGKMERLQSSGSSGLGLRVIKGGATAVASSRDLGEESVATLLKDTLELVEVTDSDAHAGLPEAGSLGGYEGALDIYHPMVAEMPLADKEAYLKAVESAGLEADDRVANSSGK